MQIIPALTYAQSLYDAGAPKATDKDVSAAVMSALSQLMPSATNKPTGGEIEPVNIKQPANADKALAASQSLYAKQAAGSISLTLLGEDHTDAQDAARANKFISAINAGSLTPSIIVYERGMTYPTPSTSVHIVRESNLTTISGARDFGLGLSRAQRSMVVAGYLVLLVGGGSQADINKILLFFGANHNDILKYFGYFAQHSPASYLLREPQSLINVLSNVPN